MYLQVGLLWGFSLGYGLDLNFFPSGASDTQENTTKTMSFLSSGGTTQEKLKCKSIYEFYAANTCLPCYMLCADDAHGHYQNYTACRHHCPFIAELIHCRKLGIAGKDCHVLNHRVGIQPVLEHTEQHEDEHQLTRILAVGIVLLVLTSLCSVAFAYCKRSGSLLSCRLCNKKSNSTRKPQHNDSSQTMLTYTARSRSADSCSLLSDGYVKFQAKSSSHGHLENYIHPTGHCKDLHVGSPCTDLPDSVDPTYETMLKSNPTVPSPRQEKQIPTEALRRPQRIFSNTLRQINVLERSWIPPSFPSLAEAGFQPHDVPEVHVASSVSVGSERSLTGSQSPSFMTRAVTGPDNSTVSLHGATLSPITCKDATWLEYTSGAE